MLGISVRKVQYKLHDYQQAPKSHAPVVDNAQSQSREAKSS